VDFELELIHKDEINVAYILVLLANYREATPDAQAEHRQKIMNVLNNSPQLRSKRELIEQFIDEYLIHISEPDLIEEAFEKYWEEQKVDSFLQLCEDEKLIKEKVNEVIETYLYDQRLPLKDDIVQTMEVKPKLLERKSVVPRVMDKIIDHVGTFYENMGDLGFGDIEVPNIYTYQSPPLKYAAEPNHRNLN